MESQADSPPDLIKWLEWDKFNVDLFFGCFCILDSTWYEIWGQ